MIKLIETGGPYGDCTSYFVVKFDRPYTIGEFIKEIYEEDTNGAWGHVRVLNGREWWDGIDICFYRYGKWETPCPPEYLDRVIESATCNGGWSLLNFYVTLKEVPEIDYKEVYFHEYCETCKFKDLPDYEDPCNECLEYPMNLYSSKPVCWKEKDA